MADATESTRSNRGRIGGIPARRVGWAGILAAGLGAATATALLLASDGAFTFADRAIAAAGENPPPSVSIRLGRLVDLQGLARAALGLGLMGLALGISSYAGSPRGASRGITIVGLLSAALAGGTLGAAAGAGGAVAFGLRDVGDQDLAVASVVHGIVWGTVGGAMGIAAGLRGGPDRGRAIGRGASAGLLWGLAYPPLFAAISPWAHIERLIPASATAAASWSAIGALILGIGVAMPRVGLRPSPRGEAAAADR